MRGQLVLLTTSLLTNAVVAGADTNTRPIVRAEPALVEIGAQAPGRSLITLPSLEFPLRIEPRCEEDASVTYVSISVADTRKTFAMADFIEKLSLEAMLRLPQRQISPLAIEKFCTNDSRPANEDSIRIEDAFTAHVSLHCSSDTRQSVIYETLPLDISIRCVIESPERTDDSVSEQPDDHPNDHPNDQESSSAVTRF